VDAVGSGGEGDVGAGVDEKSRGQLQGAKGQFAGFGYGLDRLAGQRFQFSSGEIFFAELDVVDAGASGFRNFSQQSAMAGEFVSGEGGAVGDVVEKAAFSHSLFWRQGKSENR
jgi:hypothetical protein